MGIQENTNAEFHPLNK